MAAHDIVVIGGSAGGVEALIKLVGLLPRDLPAAIFVVIHIAPESPSVLPTILDRAGPLPASRAEDGAPIEAGHIYVAPPDRHLVLEPQRMRVVHGPVENGHRPAVDPLFRSAAESFGERAVGVILSGTLDDGVEGLMVLKRLGGIAIVQDPESAIFPGMPTHALEHVDADYVLPVETMPKVLERLAHDVTPPAPAPVAGGESTSSVPHTTPQPVGFTCPECGGNLFELREGNLVRYQCRVGHAYSPGSMLSEKSRAVDAALWTALNALEERAELLKRMAEAAQARNHRITAERFAQHAASTAAQANTLRELLLPEHASELMDRIVDRAAHPEER